MGLFFGHFFDTYFRWFFGRFGLQMPLVADYCVLVGEMRCWGAFMGSRKVFVFMGNVGPFFSKKNRDQFLTWKRIVLALVTVPPSELVTVIT